ncbi:glycosyltransferase [candidate division KSB1 bacterium]
MERISVIIPVNKESEFVQDCLQSIINSTYRNIEIILIDNGTAQDMDAIMDEFDSDISIVTHKYKNLAQAHNYGIKHSNGVYISLFNADDINGKMRLELSMKRFEDEPKLGMVFCGTTFINENNEFLTGISRFPKFERNQFLGHMFERNWINSISTTLIKADVLKKIGGFDKSFDFAEDYDLFLRVGSVSQVDYIDLPLVRYRMDSRKMKPDANLFQSYEIKAVRKHDPGEIAAGLSALYKNEENFRISFGKTLYRIGMKEQALLQFQRSLELNNKNADGYFYTGNCYFDLGKLDHALTEYDACLKLNAQHVGCLNNLGILYFHQGEYARSLMEFKKATQINSFQHEPHFNLACLKKKESPETLRLSFHDSMSQQVMQKNSHVRIESHFGVSL